MIHSSPWESRIFKISQRNMPHPFHKFTTFTRKLFGGKLFISTEKAMATHSSTLAWKIPWTEGPGRLQSMGSLGVRHDWATSLSLFTFMHFMATHSSVLAWRIPGTGEPGRLPSMGSHRVGHDWSDLAAAAVSPVKNEGNNSNSAHRLAVNTR